MRHPILAIVFAAALLPLSACTTDPDTPVQTWKMVFDSDYLAKEVGIPGALLSVWGTSDSDVWMVGGAQEATPTSAPIILNWDGTAWHRLVLPKVLGTFWWVAGSSNDILWFAGKDGLVVRWSKPDRVYTRQTIPGNMQLWGILPFSESDVWAVGGEAADCHDNLACGVIWHFDGSYWSAPKDLPAGWNTSAWFKVFGRNAKDFFVCGLNGHILHWNGSTWSDEIPGDAGTSPAKLLTGSCSGSLCVAVGGEATGVIVEHDGTKWTRKSVPGLDPLNGVFVNPDGSAIAVGYTIWRRSTDGVWSNDTSAPVASQQFHAVCVDPTGGAWAVGGDLFGFKTSQFAYIGGTTVPKPVPATP